MPRDLSALAKLYGVRPAYRDNSGRRVTAAPDALVGLLKAIGAPLDAPPGAADALRARRVELQQRCIEPVLVAWEGSLSVRVRLPGKAPGAPVRAELLLEDGSRQALPQAAAARHPDGAGGASVVLDFPGAVPLGYHRLIVHAGRHGGEAHVFSAPRAARRRFSGGWGIFAPAYALHSRDTWGAGDAGDLAALAGFMGEYGGSVLATLPMFATFPQEASPYRPVSRLFWEERYIDVAAIPEFQACSEASDLAASQGFRRKLARLRSGGLIDYPAVTAAKRSVLELVADRFFSHPGRRRADFEKFLEQKPEAEEYARFRAAMEQHGASGQSGRLPARIKPGGWSERARRYHLFAQWAAHEQLSALGIDMEASGRQLLFDLPMGVHPDGYDAWSNPDCFISGMSIGAPGDMFFPQGQNWGMPPPNPEMLRQRGHHLWRRCLDNVLGPAGALRIDHIMGFHRLFLIPDGATAAEGTYLEYPAEELYAAALIEAHRKNAALIGEDLGTVEESVRRRMRRHGIYGSYVMQFEFRPEAKALTLPAAKQCASLNTHDTAPFASYWTGGEIDEREEMGMLDPAAAREERRLRKAIRKTVKAGLKASGHLKGSSDTLRVAGACLAFLGGSKAGLVLASLEDLWGETRRQNLPGTGPEMPNWRRKTLYPLEALREQPQVGRILTGLEQARKDAHHGKK